MKQKLISALISLALSLCLLLGAPTAQDFAFYVFVVMNVLVWAGLLSGLIKGEVAKKLLRHAWVSSLSTLLQIYALVVSGHSVLAASSFLVSLFMIIAAIKACEDESGVSV
ncbi:hypothetical protein JFT42_01360 [Pseudomonas haemolytica]|uniref:hypothetical protein n=1 Tax=Pseudomonas haemolytica TaxID=2600065 RepID=UPI0018E7C164|nr:hypothetical protein [Pseudomonas haemolytica]MBJ2244299.1 hypothetical protein [Pseudomonas haemolytica]